MANATSMDPMIILSDILVTYPDGIPDTCDRLTHERSVKEFFTVAEAFSSRSEEAIVEELQYWTNGAKSFANIHHFLIVKIKLHHKGNYHIFGASIERRPDTTKFGPKETSSSKSCSAADTFNIFYPIDKAMENREASAELRDIAQPENITLHDLAKVALTVSTLQEKYNLYTAQCIGYALSIFYFTTGRYPKVDTTRWNGEVEGFIRKYGSWTGHGQDEFRRRRDGIVHDYRIAKKRDRKRRDLQESEALLPSHTAVGSNTTVALSAGE